MTYIRIDRIEYQVKEPMHFRINIPGTNEATEPSQNKVMIMLHGDDIGNTQTTIKQLQLLLRTRQKLLLQLIQIIHRGNIYTWILLIILLMDIQATEVFLQISIVMKNYNGRKTTMPISLAIEQKMNSCKMFIDKKKWNYYLRGVHAELSNLYYVSVKKTVIIVYRREDSATPTFRCNPVLSRVPTFVQPTPPWDAKFRLA